MRLDNGYIQRWPSRSYLRVVGVYAVGADKRKHANIFDSIVVSFFYWFISASIAELASAIPSAAGGKL